MRDLLLLPMRVIQASYLLAWSIFWISAALVMRLLTGGTTVPLNMARQIWAPGLLWSVPWLGKLQIEVTGLENIDFSKPYFFASNHLSILDIPVLFRVLPVPLVFVLKEELRKVPFLGWYVSAMGMIFVRRREKRQSLEALKQGEERVRAGNSILAFPEGTRSRDGSVGPFKPGTFLTALDAGIPVVPVALDGTGSCLPPGGFRPSFGGTIRVAVGAPIETAHLDRGNRREVAEATREAVLILQSTFTEDPLKAPR